jgi:hypothetical protein
MNVTRATRPAGVFVIRVAAAAVLGIHGLIHLIGFVTPWRIATLEGFPYRTSGLGGAVELGDGGARRVGLVWLALAFGFVAVAYGVWHRRQWAPGMTGGLAVASVVVCVLGLPDAGAGLAINIGILAALASVVLRDQRSAAAA